MTILDKYYKKIKSQIPPRGQGEQPGHYLYEEKPLEEYEGSEPQEVDYGAIKQFESGEPIMRQLRRNLQNVDNIKQALAIHIKQFEQQRGRIQELIGAVENDHLTIQEVEGSVVVSMAKAVALVDKIRSGLETTNLLAVKYEDLIFAVQVEVEKRKLYIQHSSESIRATGYSDVMVFEQFAQQYSEGKNPEEYKNFEMALKRAWFRYRSAQAQIKEFEVKYLRRYGQVRDDLDTVLQKVLDDINTANKWLSDATANLESWVLAIAAETQSFNEQPSQTRAAQLAENIEQQNIQEQPELFPPRNVPKEQIQPVPQQPRPTLPVPPEFEKAPELPESLWERLPNSSRIRYAAVNNYLINLTYQKQGDPPRDPEEDVIKNYIVEPYSYRVKNPLNKGGQTTWYLFAWDQQDNQIKAYLVKRIQNVEVLTQKFNPRYEVEFSAPASGKW